MAPKTPAKTPDKADGDGGKAGRLTTDDQFKFLISCIRYSSNGKVDFNAVATECEIVTKEAAAKRYERLMKAHGLQHASSPMTPRDASTKSTPRKAATPKTKGSAKKRKLGEDETSDAGEDASEKSSPVKKEETEPNASSSSPIKKEAEENGSNGFNAVNTPAKG